MFHGPGPGRPKGSPNKNTASAREVARGIVEDPGYRANLRERIVAGLAPQMEQLLWFYAYGKPKETIEVQGEVTVDKIVREIVDPRNEPQDEMDSVH